ncbi:GNAT family N-acetyltransferase [Pelagibius sp.]|uniref:GNAT family N-acetyltransferase n=1 Tax=Pelagibius sp. TaxID=1931238 RepID=UPI0026185DC7|nr:GNAT family N-acetyltransferase [Pelagibius sp.]
MSGGEIRAASPCDVILLASMQAACFAPVPGADETGGAYVGEPWSARAWAEVLAMPGSFALIAALPSQPIGFLLAQVLVDEAEVLSLGVLPSHRRAGHGRRLLQTAMDLATERGVGRFLLEVAEINHSAHTFYASNGFARIGRRTAYYRDQTGAAIDALILAKPLAGA